MKGTFHVEGNIVDVEKKTIGHGNISINCGEITKIDITGKADENSKGPFIMPGFVDAHIHIEDTLLSPCEFARVAVKFGNVASVCDPHEIANVMGIPGIKYMIEEGKRSPYKFFNGAPSCVPATDHETSGARLGPKEIEELMADPEITHLSEFMRFPEVIRGEKYDLDKIAAAKKHKKPVDGHCPMVRGRDLDRYIAAGIITEHECTELDEAEEKANKGMKIIIREGSAARNLDKLHSIIDKYPETVMLCTDDIHADYLLDNGYINYIAELALKHECKLFNVLRASTYNAVKHYKLNVGLLKVGDPADFIVVEDLKKFKTLKTYIGGNLVYDSPNILISPIRLPIVNNFNIGPITEADVAVPAKGPKMHVIEIMDKSLLTNDVIADVTLNSKNEAISNPDKDIIKIVDLSRYSKSKPGVGFVKGYGLKSGAVAFSISHDSHNIICIGVEDADITTAINLIIKNKGGASLSYKGETKLLSLPIAGLMSDLAAEDVAKQNKEIQNQAKEMGCKLAGPFPTLSFMALTVIPSVKITDKGVFDVNAGKLIDIFDVK